MTETHEVTAEKAFLQSVATDSVSGNIAASTNSNLSWEDMKQRVVENIENKAEELVETIINSFKVALQNDEEIIYNELISLTKLLPEDFDTKRIGKICSREEPFKIYLKKLQTLCNEKKIDIQLHWYVQPNKRLSSLEDIENMHISTIRDLANWIRYGHLDKVYLINKQWDDTQEEKEIFQRPTINTKRS